MIRREPAWRLLSGEFNATNVILKAENSKEPNYVLSPLGAKINRVFIIGSVIEMDDLGSDNRSFYRIRLADPTGIFYLTVGEYQPSALRFVRDMEIPSFIAVIGKVKTFKPENGGLYLSIRPESIYPADAKLRNNWLLTTIKSLKSRLEAIREAHQMTDPTINQIKALGYSTTISDGIVKAIEKYGRISLESYQMILKDALQYLIDQKEGEEGIVTKKSEESATSSLDGGSKKLVSKTIEKRDNSEVEKNILEILGKGSSNRKLGLNWNELLLEVKRRGIEKKVAEETVRDLMEKGVVYEPILGVLKKI